jgi:hypothetical protein
MQVDGRESTFRRSPSDRDLRLVERVGLEHRGADHHAGVPSRGADWYEDQPNEAHAGQLDDAAPFDVAPGRTLAEVA